MGYYRHDIPGRLRLRIPSLKKNPKKIRELKYLTEDLSGIKSISMNSTTGSVVFIYNPEIISSHSIVALLAREGIMDSGTLSEAAHNSKRALEQIGASATKALVGLVLNRALEGSPLSMVTLLI